MYEKIYSHFLKYPHICTDTRRLVQGDFFWALKGKRYDANEMVKEALEKGASAVVTQNPAWKNHPNVFYVPDTLQALQELATFHRSQFNIPVIAICGSNGKTTTKELAYRALSTQYRTLYTEGNLNNHIGIPLTLLKLHKTHQIAVIEMGANHQGEIAQYCTWVKPTYGLTTNIGKSHLEGFGGLEGVAKGEGELYDYLMQQNGFLFVNQDDKYLREQTLHAKNKLTYGIYHSADIQASFQTDEQGKVSISIEYPSKKLHYPSIKSQIYGHYNAENILAACAIAIYFGISELNIRKAVGEYIPQNNRSQIKQYKGYTFIMDAYNANPSSMQVALKAFSDQKTEKKKVAILGDMFELGEESIKEHEEIGLFCNTLNIDEVIFIGTLMQHAKKRCLLPSWHFESVEEFLEVASEHIQPDSIVLLKASRSMKLERIWEFIHHQLIEN
ncbi:MAG: UDP-N-acetylmuramoyl-tripeptide--D-alanyl-D-alanine ligase [Bacteroidia bacterium]|nr:UDP-N-acetylmuramoyl-tripeptide--D-alanyl-D-alanine ligase [Bacteroidia bacterium]MDW8302059.1 UDP-N-acetylmuramoyl-tripeptide--D-alanyl-D-alanine ligase [Bacteroidia bacterium]